MRRIAVTALVLLPILAQAQARQNGTSTAPQASAPSTLQAKVTPPAGIHPAVPVATPAPAAAAGDGSDIMVPVHESVIQNSAGSSDANDSGTISYSMLGGDPVTAAKLIQSKAIVLSLKDVRSAQFSGTVVVQMTVATDGTPRNLAITRSGGDALNKRALDAVSQYRFKPAMQDGLAVESTVTVQIKLEAQKS